MQEKTNQSKTMGMIKFKEALMYVFPEIVNAYYLIDEYREEFVSIDCKTKKGERYSFEVCVTCDSVLGMYDDVWKACKRRFC